MKVLASEAFRKGMLVIATDEAVKAGVLKPGQLGEVVGFGVKCTWCVTVRRNDRKTPRVYHMKFWRDAAP